MPRHKDLKFIHTAKICDQFKINDKEFVFIAAYFNAISFTEDFESKAAEKGVNFDLETNGINGFLDDDFIRESIIDCLAFYSRVRVYLPSEMIGDYHPIECAAHDFWYTRNGHGTGFWDKSNEYGDWQSKKFTNIAESFGESFPIYEYIFPSETE